MRSSIVFALAMCSSLSSPLLFAQQSAPLQNRAAANQEKASNATEEHSHDEHGPNGGELVEVGKHEYHLEICLDEKEKQIIVYLLDKELKAYVPINQTQILANFKYQGKPTQVKLLAVPRKEDPKGASSCFGIKSPQLMDAMHDDASELRLVVRFGNRQYNIKVAHNHDHAGHDHSGHGHEGHNHGPKATKKK